MNDQTKSLQEVLINCVEAAKMPGTVLDYDATESVNTESKTTSVTVRFTTETSSNASLNVQLLLKRLEEVTDLGAIDLFATPKRQLVFLGARGSRNCKIVVQI